MILLSERFASGRVRWEDRRPASVALPHDIPKWRRVVCSHPCQTANGGAVSFSRWTISSASGSSAAREIARLAGRYGRPITDEFDHRSSRNSSMPEICSGRNSEDAVAGRLRRAGEVEY